MQQEIKLVIKEDCHGIVGFTIAEIKPFEDFGADTSGTLTAHDILEHQKGFSNIGSLGDELIALGGVYFVRGEYSDLSRPSNIHSTEENLASDVANMARIHLCQKVPLRELYDVNADYTEHVNYHIFEEVAQIAKKSFLDECEYYDDDENCYTTQELNEYLKASINFMCIGYDLAYDRFESQGYANNLYWEIARVVGEYSSMLEFEGHECMLIINGTMVYIEEHYEFEEEEEKYY